MKSKRLTLAVRPDLKDWRNKTSNCHKNLNEIRVLKSSIDFPSPKIFSNTNLIKLDKVSASRENQRIAKENLRILRNLVNISSASPQTRSPKKYNVSNFHIRLWKQVKILEENVNISYRLKNATLSVDFTSYEKDYQNHLRYKQNILEAKQRRFKAMECKNYFKRKSSSVKGNRSNYSNQVKVSDPEILSLIDEI
ncbi:unnamed protein product [Blepharisma stoltei]|uniref:Uncharacterized protein n=1 Tax=Blepharisma stoltei TaxID=1481888 RepID=A0AAU9K4I0_9CILI|nr:unnamed protein product [Blepharisma stoltei]